MKSAIVLRNTSEWACIQSFLSIVGSSPQKIEVGFSKKNGSLNGFLKTVEVLLNAGALPNPNNIRSKYNKLPLVAASGQGHIDIVKLLIDRGAEINRQEGRNGIEDTALTAATKTKRIEIVQYLLSRGADASISLLYSGTALDIAINRKLPEIAELLAKHSAQP